MVIDKTSGVPVFRQIAADIREKISSGEYAPGAQLPSEQDLTGVYNVSRPTIREAVGLLRAEGVVYSQHGRGVFVTPPRKVQRLSRTRLSKKARQENRGAFLGDAAAGGFTPSTTVKISFEGADDRIAELLGIEPGAEVCVRDRVMRADGLAVMLAVSRFPCELTRGTLIEEVNTGPGGAYARLEDAGHTFAPFEEVVRTRMPTPEEASTLQLAEGVPTLFVTRIARNTDGVALEVNDMVLAGDRYELVYEIPAI